MREQWRSGCCSTTATISSPIATLTVNRLRWHLLQLCPELERSVKRGSFNQSRVLDRVDRRLRQMPAGAQVRVARDQVARIRQLNRQAELLKRELLELVKAYRPRLLAETGCGPLVAAILIGRTAAPISFVFTLPSAPTPHYLASASGSPATADCPGSLSDPEAAPGQFCIYEGGRFNTGQPAICNPTANVCGTGVSPFGAFLQVNSSSLDYFANGTWAATAP